MDFLFRLFPFDKKEVKALPLRPVVIVLVASVCLILVRFCTNSRSLVEWVSALDKGVFLKMNGLFNSHPDADLWDLVYWGISVSAFYLVIPVLVIKLLFRQSVAMYGLKIKGMFLEWKAYLAMAIVMFPIIVAVSFSSEFVNTYPFHRFSDDDKLFPQFLIWETVYILQFFALEFFFRGFLVLGFKPYMGWYSVLLMTLPYCMIHFNKPLPECVGSIFAGLILGAMSYRTGSVWLGAALHVFVALSMDLLSLWHRGICIFCW